MTEPWTMARQEAAERAIADPETTGELWPDDARDLLAAYRKLKADVDELVEAVEVGAVNGDIRDCRATALAYRYREGGA